MTRRREQVLDAAVTVLGAEGARRLTYQAVDSAAGVPAGTASNYFRNRDALIEGVVAHLEALDRRDWEPLATARKPLSLTELTIAVTHLVHHAIGPGRFRTAARYALLLEAVGRPELRCSLLRGRAAIIDWACYHVGRLGSTAPEQHCRLLLDCVDGLVLHQIAVPEPDFDPATAVQAILRGMLGRQTGPSGVRVP